MTKSIVSSRFSGGINLSIFFFQSGVLRELESPMMDDDNICDIYCKRMRNRSMDPVVNPELLNVLYILLHFNVVCCTLGPPIRQLVSVVGRIRVGSFIMNV